jgi:hypothetical protein
MSAPLSTEPATDFALTPTSDGLDNGPPIRSAEFLDSPRATNLVLDGNPCHEEALEIARMAGVDFIVNTVLTRRLELLDVFSGHLEEAHRRAVLLLRGIVAIPVEREVDVVLTHGGYVGINHYQIAKAAVNALPVVREGGLIILAACERDEDPIGPTTYRTLLHLLKLQGPDGYLATLRQRGWKFTKDQWEPQMWGKVLKKVGEEGLIYCSAVLSRKEHQFVPGGAGWDYLPDGEILGPLEATRAMVQHAVISAAHHPRWAGRLPSMAFIPEGPYAVCRWRHPRLPSEPGRCARAAASARQPRTSAPIHAPIPDASAIRSTPSRIRPAASRSTP